MEKIHLMTKGGRILSKLELFIPDVRTIATVIGQRSLELISES